MALEARGYGTTITRGNTVSVKTGKNGEIFYGVKTAFGWVGAFVCNCEIFCRGIVQIIHRRKGASESFFSWLFVFRWRRDKSRMFVPLPGWNMLLSKEAPVYGER